MKNVHAMSSGSLLKKTTSRSSTTPSKRRVKAPAGPVRSVVHAREQLPEWADKITRTVLGATSAAAITLSSVSLPPPAIASAASTPAIGELAVQVTGMGGTKDPEAILRNALPMSQSDIREVQSKLEQVSEELKKPGTRSYSEIASIATSCANTVASRTDAIAKAAAPGKGGEVKTLLSKVSTDLKDMKELVNTFSDDSKGSVADKDKIVAMSKAILRDVGNVELLMVDGFPANVPAKYASLPQLRGRATVKMEVEVDTTGRVISGVIGNVSTSYFLRNAASQGTNLSNAGKITFPLTVVVDGYNAPLTSGNFVDLVNKGFYEGMKIQRADDFVVQFGDPDPKPRGTHGYVDPNTGELRKIPLEVKVASEKDPIYEATFEERGIALKEPALPFNAFGTMALAREQFDNNSGSSQIFFLLKESELTPTGLNLLDGAFATFAYVTEGAGILGDIQAGDVIKHAEVVEGIENLKEGDPNAAPIEFDEFALF